MATSTIQNNRIAQNGQQYISKNRDRGEGGGVEMVFGSKYRPLVNTESPFLKTRNTSLKAPARAEKRCGTGTSKGGTSKW